jgi:hypothetical protein
MAPAIAGIELATEGGEKMPTDKLLDVSPLALRMSSPFQRGLLAGSRLKPAGFPNPARRFDGGDAFKAVRIASDFSRPRHGQRDVFATGTSSARRCTSNVPLKFRASASVPACGAAVCAAG